MIRSDCSSSDMLATRRELPWQRRPRGYTCSDALANSSASPSWLLPHGSEYELLVRLHAAVTRSRTAAPTRSARPPHSAASTISSSGPCSRHYIYCFAPQFCRFVPFRLSQAAWTQCRGSNADFSFPPLVHCGCGARTYSDSTDDAPHTNHGSDSPLPTTAQT